MSDSKQHLDPTNAHPFIHNDPISLSQPDHNVFDPHIQPQFLPANDSNSDDTQFEIQNSELNSNDTSPVKEKASVNQVIGHETPQLQSNFSPQERVSQDQEFVPEKNLTSARETSINKTDHSDFVDYFLAHDDFLQALDDYSRSVGQTSAFPCEISCASPLQQHHSPRSSLNPIPNKQEATFATSVGNAKKGRIAPGETTVNGSSRAISSQRRDEGPKVQRGTRDDMKQSRSATLPRRSEKRKPRTYSQAIPSQHCHICSRRPTETSPHAVCGNLLKGRCRKTICTKCFHQFRWDLKAAREAPPGTWECPHCRGECPQRAQCVIYNRTSDRRRMKLINHRKKKDQTKVSNSSKFELNRKTNGKTESRSESPNSGTTEMTPLAMLNCGSPMQNSVAQRNKMKSEKKGTETKGISKATRAFGVSEHGHLALMVEGIREDALTTWSEKREREVSDVAGSLQKTSVGLAQKYERNATSKEMMVKSETGILGHSGLDTDGRNVCDNVTGVFGYMNLPDDLLNVTSEDQNGKGMSAIAEGENEGLEPNLSVLDMDESFDSKGDAQCDQARLRMWDEDETKYEQMETGDFHFQENVLDLDTFG